VKTGNARMRVRVAINHSISEVGRSYSAVAKAREPAVLRIPDRQVSVPVLGRVVDIHEKRSLADPALVAKREILRSQISDLKRDNERLRILIIQETN